MTYRKDWTVFFVEPGKYVNMKCKVCDTECEVERNKIVHNSSVVAMADRKSKFDLFKCPNVEKQWHYKLEKLVLEKEKTASNKISNLLRDEINEIKGKFVR